MMWWLLLFGFFLCMTLLQILIWVLFPLRWVLQKQARPSSTVPAPYPAVSVVVCARNEAANLAQHLPLLLEQTYPAPFEVVLVDDDSSDHTATVVQGLQARFPHLHYLRIHPKTHPGKKMALSQGIRQCRYPWLAFTDADCAPASPRWLQGLLSATRAPGIVLGYAPLHTTAHWLNGWARFETAYTAMQYFATAHAGWPFMGVGRNMALHQSVFQAANGFAAHLHIPGGDDDLLVNSIADGRNTHLCLDPDTFVYSSAKRRLSNWIAQKRRHLTAGTAYKTWHNLVLGGVAFSHSVHYGLAVILLATGPQHWPWILGAWAARMAVVWPTYWWAFSRLKERRLRRYAPIYDGLMAIWLGAVAPVLLLFPKRSW